MENFKVADLGLAEHGWKKIVWAWQYMPSLQFLYNKYKDARSPSRGRRSRRAFTWRRRPPTCS
ncbi:hypothetical protein [Fretibacterium fastidiosum]|uniref:hypothetical protein n=1 Tax=Fretibacterium fastidiosum TaxID=651822 RepID=UPI0038FD23E1